MLEKIREKLLAFIESDKDVPLLAGFSVGFYMMLFYYSKNFALANSLEQFMFFSGYYILIPVLVLFTGYKIVRLTKFSRFRKHFLFIGTIAFFSFYVIQINSVPVSKKIAFAVVILIAVLLSKWLSKYYKLFVLLFFLMSVFNMKPLLKIAYVGITTNDKWQEHFDDVEAVVFKKRPNVYFIQPDGYVGFNTLKDSIYNFDNSKFENFLELDGFKLYRDFHSNYFSTLQSNSSIFSMKQHYVQGDVDLYKARNIIISDNAVLRTFKNNKYKTYFISEKPYLVMNRPKMGYDYTNIDYSKIPYIKDGWADNHNVFEDLKLQMQKAGTTGNFFFLEKFTPGHIHGFEAHSSGAEAEKQSYLEELRKANVWLTEVLTYINKKDPTAIVIVGADHGGFAGFKYTLQALKKTTNPKLVNSIFANALAIKWNDPEAGTYDTELKSSVNLFRTIFSYMAQDKKYIQKQEDNSSYIMLNEPKGLYRYVDQKGNIVFENVQN